MDPDWEHEAHVNCSEAHEVEVLVEIQVTVRSHDLIDLFALLEEGSDCYCWIITR